jgi:hypothetical protein
MFDHLFEIEEFKDYELLTNDLNLMKTKYVDIKETLVYFRSALTCRSFHHSNTSNTH